MPRNRHFFACSIGVFVMQFSYVHSFYQCYEIVGGNDEEAPAFSDALQVGASTLIFKVMEELKISELLESIHGETDANLIKDLVSYMIIRQTSTMQHRCFMKCIREVL